MTFLLAAAGGLLLFVLIHLAIGWFLASGLHKSALRIGGREIEEPGIWVRAFDGSSVTLSAQEPRRDIGHPGQTTMVFDGGSARLGDVTAAANLEITREVIEYTGQPPVCTDALAECEPVELNPYVFLNDPSEVGLDFEEVTYESELGDMGAWVIPSSDPSSWVVMAHGWTAHRQELLRMLPTFNRAGFNALIIDYRNDVGAPRDPSGMYRFSLTEWRDLESAVEYVEKRGAERVALAGCSTGAALVMGFIENSTRTGSVTGLILDSPNIVLSEAIRHGTKHVRATPLMIEFGLWIADLRWGVDWETTNYVERSDEFLDIPTLVFHGTSDHRVPIAVSRRLEAKVPDHVELVEFPAAGHVMSWNADQPRYESYLEAFLRRI